jgi:hypothetical protein
MFRCWKCDATIDLPAGGRVGTRDACPHCDADLHCCRNCDFYDPSKNNQCSEPQAEWQREKEAGNYCDYFRAASGLGAAKGSSRAAPAVSDAKKTFDSLFKL